MQYSLGKMSQGVLCNNLLDKQLAETEKEGKA